MTICKSKETQITGCWSNSCRID